jgi:hypothetical protein
VSKRHDGFPETAYAFVDAYGADPSGLRDSTSAFNQAIATTKQVVVGQGIYRVGGAASLTRFGRHQGMFGVSSALSLINYVGSGTCLEAFDPKFSNSDSYGGSFGGFHILGYDAAPGSVGLAWGNLLGARVDDIAISGFGGGGTGLRLRNSPGASWSEQARWTAIRLVQNTDNVVFDSGSFAYSIYEFLIVADAGQNGMTLQNDAQLQGVRLEIRGNFNADSDNRAWVVGVDPAGEGTGSSQLSAAQLFVNVEADGSGRGHVSIKMAGDNRSALTGVGVLNFLSTNVGFAAASVGRGPEFGFSGVVNETSLSQMIPGDGLTVLGGTGWRAAGGLAQPAYDGMNIFPEAGDVQAMSLPNGTTAVSGFQNAPFLTARRLEIFVKQPAASPWGTLRWPANVRWAGGTNHLSAFSEAVDKVTLTYLPSEDTWFGTIDLAFA